MDTHYKGEPEFSDILQKNPDIIQYFALKIFPSRQCKVYTIFVHERNIQTVMIQMSRIWVFHYDNCVPRV